MEVDNIVRRVKCEFEEMPGLKVTPAQAMRLWGLEREICHRVIDELVGLSFLKWTAGGQIVRTTGEPSAAAGRPGDTSAS